VEHTKNDETVADKLTRENVVSQRNGSKKEYKKKKRTNIIQKK
jgi:hypothetical protein